MLKTLSQAYQLIGRDRPGRWALLIVLAVVVSGIEMLGAILVFVLLNLIVDPTGQVDLPIIGDLKEVTGDIDDQALLIGTAVVIFAFFMVRSVVTVGAKYVENRVAFNAGAQLANTLVAGYLAWPYSVHLRRNTAELIRNGHTATQELVTSMFLPTIKMFAHSIVIVGMLALLASFAPAATGLAILILGGAAFLLLLAVQPRLKRLGEISHQMSRETLGNLQEALQGVREVKLLGREKYFAKRYARSRIAFARARYLRATVGALPPIVMEMSLIAFILVLFGFTAVSDAPSEGIVSILGLFAYAGMRLRPSLQQVIGGFNSLRYSTAPLEDLHADLIATEGLSASPQGTTKRLPFEKTIRVDHVSFRYEGAEVDALTDVDLTIHKGDQIGVCGPTGGGKSTLIDLLTGLLEPTDGRVTVDDVDIRGSERAWQQGLGVVSQSIFLIDGTLRENIALGQDEAHLQVDALDEAVELAQLSEMVEALSEGLDTMVGERGVRLSGGQRQRVAIARALYRRPDVLILDEGTSALDNATEAKLLSALERLRGENTLILVAHRLSTVRTCDSILFVANGGISGEGPYDYLLEHHPAFRAMALSED
ncbi:MAG: ABC transporter ATP-binding protein [Chloroflexi bacterium]|nr:ABC transporter ATP-binding protein [Chloroflexota bacterium]